jgi:hypothetical protein
MGPPRVLQNKAETSESSGISVDTVAVAMTAVLALGGFLVQARVAKQADMTQQEIERAQNLHQQQREHSQRQLERVQARMSTAIQPVRNAQGGRLSALRVFL